MTVTLELRSDEAEVLTEQANAQGVDVETILHRLVEQLPRRRQPVLTEKQQSALSLLDGWGAERQTMTLEELAESDADFEETKANINRWRAEEGRGPAFR